SQAHMTPVSRATVHDRRDERRRVIVLSLESDGPPRYRAAADPGASNRRMFRTAHGGASCGESVSVMRTNRPRTGANAIAVGEPVLLPSATGALHWLPSADTCT